MESISKIKELAGELRSIYSEIDNNRDLWHAEIRKLINKTFKTVISETRLHLHVCTYDEILNLESIHLTFGVLNSGLMIEPKKKKGGIPPMVLLKRGGLLAYSLMANGKVSVVIQYPYIEDIYGDPQKIMEIGIFLPSEITQNLILDHIELFFIEMIKWEKEEKKLIGFQLKKAKH